MAKINETLKQLRLDRGMTQEQVAERVGLTRQAVSSYESGRTLPGVDILERLATVYEVELTDIIYNQSKSLRLYRALKLSSIVMAVVTLAAQLISSIFMWMANQFFPLAPGAMSDGDTLVLAARAHLINAHYAAENLYCALFPLFCVAILVLIFCQRRPLPVKTKLLCVGGFASACAVAVLPWALTDSFYTPNSYLLYPALCLAQLAFFLILSLVSDLIRVRKQKHTCASCTDTPSEGADPVVVPVYKRWWFWLLIAVAAAVIIILLSVFSKPNTAELEPVTNPAFTLNGVDFPQNITMQDFIDRGWKRDKVIEQQGDYTENDGVTDLVYTGYRLTYGEHYISVYLDKDDLQSGIEPNECVIDRISFFPINIVSFTLGDVELTTLQKDQVIDLLGEPDRVDDDRTLSYTYLSRPEEGICYLNLGFSHSSNTVGQVIVCLGESIFP